MNNVLIYLLCTATFLVVGWGIHKHSPFFSALGSDLTPNRFSHLDGLRGFLAMGVFFTHTILNFHFYHTGEWSIPQYNFYTRIGTISVNLFFMITGFLFWTKVLNSDGRPDARALYVSRLRRLLPLYFFSVLLVGVVVVVETKMHANEGVVTLVKQLRSWFAFGFLPYGEINGLLGAHRINAVYWTLAYEWSFYLALPFLAVFAFGYRFAMLLAIGALYATSSPAVFNFLFGMVAAWLIHRNKVPALFLRSLFAFLSFTALVVAVMHTESDYSLMQSGLLFVLFISVVRGNSLFGVLSWPASKILGTISYSLYLLHCIFLYVALEGLNNWVPVSNLNENQFWLVACLCGCATILFSSITYRYIEHPFLARQRR